MIRKILCDLPHAVNAGLMRHRSTAVTREFLAQSDDDIHAFSRTGAQREVGRPDQLHRSVSSRDGETLGPLTME